MSSSRRTAMRGINQKTARFHNEALIKNLIRERGTLTKVEAARATGLSANATSTIFKKLENINIILPCKPIRGKVGQPSTPFEINRNAHYYFGIKIGRRSLELVVIDYLGTVLARRARPHRYPILSSVRNFIKKEIPIILNLANLKKTQISGTGISIPSTLCEWLHQLDATPIEINAWRDFYVHHSLENFLPEPILVENEGNSACRAEWMFGNKMRQLDSIYFFLGTLISSGMIINNCVFRDRHANSSDFGYLRLPLEPSGARLIDCASLITLERKVLKNSSTFDSEALINGQWAALEPSLTQWITLAGRSLAYTIISTVAVFDLAHVTLDGPFSDSILKRLCVEVEMQLNMLDQSSITRPQILSGSLRSHAHAIGAAAGHINLSHLVPAN